jgi:hypothetical protein
MVLGRAGSKALPADLFEQILGKTDGAPLFVEEPTKSILELADLRAAADRWEYAGRAGILAIPLILRDSLMARLDRFAPVREVAQIGAAIEREFGWELISAVAPHRLCTGQRWIALCAGEYRRRWRDRNALHRATQWGDLYRRQIADVFPRIGRRLDIFTGGKSLTYFPGSAAG